MKNGSFFFNRKKEHTVAEMHENKSGTKPFKKLIRKKNKTREENFTERKINDYCSKKEEKNPLTKRKFLKSKFNKYF